MLFLKMTSRVILTSTHVHSTVPIHTEECVHPSIKIRSKNKVGIKHETAQLLEFMVLAALSLLSEYRTWARFIFNRV